MPNNVNGATNNVDKISLWKNELANINKVVDKLLTTQNSNVFDKICGKIEELFGDIDINTKDGKIVNVKEVLDILYSIKDTCYKLKEYKDYLIAVVTQNIANLNAQTQTQEDEKKLVYEAA